MTYSHILWDFNGTILNDVETGIKSANVLLSRRNMKTIENTAGYHKVFCFPIIRYYQNLGLNLEKEPFEDLAVEWMEQYLIYSKSAKLYDGIIDILTYIKDSKIPQIILSATEKDMLKDQLTSLGILNYFDDFLGLDNIHAYSKVDIAKEWLERVKPEKAVLIGDTVHDYETATQIGADCILIANGHQCKDTLLSCGVPVYDTIRDLLKNGFPRS
jgi:phosphoglycolate phosphatase